MTKIKVVNYNRYKNKFTNRITSYQFASQIHIAPIVIAELNKILQSIPIAFIRQNESLSLVGVLSFTPGQNMYVGMDGKWLGPYIPSYFRGYPFSLVRDKTSGQTVLCYDEDSELFSEVEGEPFYDENGHPSETVQKVIEFLKHTEKSRQLTQRAVSALADAGVITKWNLKTNIADEEKKIEGLYRIDETKLNNLDKETLLHIRDNFGLPIAYAQIFSMQNISVLEKLAKIHAKTAQQNSDINIDQFFGNNDILKFDNI
jgi:hypothetical protein